MFFLSSSFPSFPPPPAPYPIFSSSLSFSVPVLGKNWLHHGFREKNKLLVVPVSYRETSDLDRVQWSIAPASPTWWKLRTCLSHCERWGGVPRIQHQASLCIAPLGLAWPIGGKVNAFSLLSPEPPPHLFLDAWMATKPSVFLELKALIPVKMKISLWEGHSLNRY